jgi:hypothetical protein
VTKPEGPRVIASLNVREFLESGSIAGVAVGMPEADGRRVLGEAEETGRGMQGVTIDAYAGRALQVSYANGRVVLLGLYFRHCEDLPIAVDNDPSRHLGSCTTIEEAQVLVKALGLSWLAVPPTRHCFLVGNVVTFVFDQDGRLESIQAS